VVTIVAAWASASRPSARSDPPGAMGDAALDQLIFKKTEGNKRGIPEAAAKLQSLGGDMNMDGMIHLR